MKNKIAFLLILFMLITVLPANAAFATQQITVIIDGKVGCVPRPKTCI